MLVKGLTGIKFSKEISWFCNSFQIWGSGESNKNVSSLAVFKTSNFYAQDYLRHQELVKTHQFL